MHLNLKSQTMVKLFIVQPENPSVTSSYIVRNACELDADILHMYAENPDSKSISPC